MILIFSSAVNAEPVQMNTSNQSVKQRELLITGCARSGTYFITKFFQHNKLDVGHERDGQFGVVSWLMAADAAKAPWGPGSAGYAFKHVFHQVREPLKTIASAGNEPERSWLYIQQFIPEIHLEDPKIVKGAKYWYFWNLLAEKKAEWTYRIEDVAGQVEEMTARLEVDLDPALLDLIPTNTNTRYYDDVYTWQDLKEALEEELYYNIIDMALRYGYEVNLD